MALDPKTIYVAQRTDDGSAWREVYISGSGLILQTDTNGLLTGSGVLPPSITVLSASYATVADTSISASWSISASFVGMSLSSSYSKTSSFADRTISSSYADYAASSSVSVSASVAISASRAVSSNFSTYAVTASYAFSSEESARASTSSYALTASYLLGQSDTASYALRAGTASYITYTEVNTVGSSWVSSSAQTVENLVGQTVSLSALTASAIQVDTLHVQTITSSIVYSSGSNKFGSDLSNTQELTGSVQITGSLYVNGGLIGETSSYSLTASYALTASLIDNTGNTGSGYLVGVPIDGHYGPGTTGSIANIQTGDRVEDAFDKVENILFKLAPARPPNLSTKSLLLSSAYTANLQGTNTTITNAVTNNTTPTFPLVGGMVAANAFSDGDQGQLTASVDGANVGDRQLTPTSDVGTYGALQITSDADFYVGQAGKAGFWNALLAQIVTTTPITTVGPHTVQLQHTQTGNTPAFTFYVDDPVSPTGVSGTVVATGSVYISGVPALVGGQSGSSVTLSATASNTVGRFYNSTRIFQGSGTGISAGNYTLPSSPLSESVQSASRAFSINAGSQSENASFTVTAFNSIGTSVGSAITNTRIRMDSALDPANRVKSGFGQFGFDGTPYEASQSIATAVEELQFLNGQFRYPTGNYTGSLPVPGPDYTSVAPGAYNNLRWVTFNMGSITDKANVRVDFSNTFGFSSVILTNFALQVRVNGSTPTGGWVDGNAAYSGTGNPTNDGDTALAVANSTTTSKLVTFGTAVKTGTVFVRIGIPAGDTKRFGGITVTAS